MKYNKENKEFALSLLGKMFFLSLFYFRNSYTNINSESDAQHPKQFIPSHPVPKDQYYQNTVQQRLALDEYAQAISHLFSQAKMV